MSDLDDFEGYILMKVKVPSENLLAWEKYAVPLSFGAKKIYDDDLRLEHDIINLTLKLPYDKGLYGAYQDYFNLPDPYTKEDLFKALRTYCTAFEAEIENITTQESTDKIKK
ncbi:MAG: hypothetical protein ACFFAN_20715 [Promethearchaeota archaeon]